MPKIAQKRKALWNQAMKADLLDSALAVLFEFGYEGMTMERVAAQAGVAKGTIYNYYQDKADLLMAILDTLFSPLKARLRGIAAMNLPADWMLRKMLHATLAHYDQHSHMIKILIQSGISHGRGGAAVEQHIHKHSAAIKGILKKTIEEGVESKAFKPVDAARTANMIDAMVFGLLFDNARFHGAKQTLCDSYADDMAALVLGGITP